MAELTEALGAAPAVVLLAGEAGIGKTRLLAEFLASAAGQRRRVLVAACAPFGQPHTLGPMIDALLQAVSDLPRLQLSAIAGALRPLFPEWSRDLPPEPAPAEDASAARHRVFRALAEVLQRLALGVLAVEDVHWADEATVEFLLFLAAQRPRRFSLVCTYRQEEVPADSLLPRLIRQASGASGRLITITPLDVPELATFVSSMLDDQHVSLEFATFLHRHTDGLPLAIEESIRLMVGRAELTQRGEVWLRRDVSNIGVPLTVRDAVLERVDRLGEEAQTVLRAVAVLSDPSSEPLVRAVAGLAAESARAGLAMAIGSGLLAARDRGLISFHHALAGKAVYGAIPAPYRQDLHLRAALALEGQRVPPVAQLARHFSAAGDVGRWIRYAEQAADVALAAGDDGTAASVLHDVILHADPPPAVLARLANKMPFSSVTGLSRHRDVVRALRSVIDAGGYTTGEEADLRLQLGRTLAQMEEFAAERAELERAVRLGRDPAKFAYAMVMLGQPQLGSPAAQCLRWLRRASDVVGRLEQPERLRCQEGIASGLLHLGEQAGWVEAARLPEAPGDLPWQHVARGALNIGDGAMQWGLYAEARRRLQIALELAEQREYLHIAEMVLVTWLHLDWLTGAWAGLADRAAKLAAADIPPMSRSEATLVVGLLAAATGDNQSATEHLELVLARSRDSSVLGRMTESAAALARVWLSAGRVDDALAVTEDAFTALRREGIWMLGADLCPARLAALVVAGRTGEAEEVLRVFARGMRGKDIPAARAALAVCRALLAEARGEMTRAAGLFGTASQAWRDLPRPHDALLAEERRASCLLAAGSGAEAVPVLEAVASGLRDLGARADADRVTRTLRSLETAASGARRGPGRPSYGDELSPRELEVVRLLVTGQSNKQIADTLVVSVRTVASHLRSAMSKLRVSSRTALAVTAVELGIIPSVPVEGKGPAHG